MRHNLHSELENFICHSDPIKIPDTEFIWERMPHVPDTGKFKYIIDIDGDSTSWTRLPNILITESVPLKVDSGFV